jgi:glycogen debranching enzyme
VRLSGRTRAELALAPGESFATTVSVRATPPPVPGFRPVPPAAPAPWSRGPLAVRSADRRLDALVRQGVADLGALLLADGGDLYCAAGSPWYLTLFGRDALWTARLALPLGHELAAGTLRALARHQGTRHDPETEEAPGKIPHELRPAHATTWLPPVYYGTVDATPLFVITLAEAWRWGMPAPQVARLLPAARRALDWLGTFDDFVAYRGSAATLVNQGWKDSADAIQHADGRVAAQPIALSEVQAYAFQAATLGAELFDAFGVEGGERWRRWAAELADRFRARFWVDGYPAIALDGGGRPVDGPASNLGHLLGTGLLAPVEEERVARTLAELDSGWGLRTLTGRAAGFDALSYHRGSVWPHDTAIAILGLARSGHREVAARLARGLICAGPWFGYRLPELYGGQAADRPVPYPSACRPQAWSAAASPALVTALLGLDVDVPAGSVRLSPMPGFGELSAEGVRIGDASVSIHVDASGVASATLPRPLRLGVQGRR